MNATMLAEKIIHFIALGMKLQMWASIYILFIVIVSEPGKWKLRRFVLDVTGLILLLIFFSIVLSLDANFNDTHPQLLSLDPDGIIVSLLSRILAWQ